MKARPDTLHDKLPDGTNHVAQSVLDATAKQIEIKTSNSRYVKR